MELVLFMFILLVRTEFGFCGGKLVLVPIVEFVDPMPLAAPELVIVVVGVTVDDGGHEPFVDATVAV